MDLVTQKNFAALIVPKSMLAAPWSWTAGSASDSTSFTSTSIDREGLSTGSLPLSADILVAYAATLGSGQTLSLSLDLQDSADNSSFADYRTNAAVVVATGPSGGGAVNGVARLTSTPDGVTTTEGTGLGGARRYLKLGVNPHLSRTGTDTAIIQSITGVFGGFDILPAPAS